MIHKSLNDMKNNRVKKSRIRVPLDILNKVDSFELNNNRKSRVFIELHKDDYKNVIDLVEKIKNFPSFERFEKEDEKLFNRVLNFLNDEIFLFSVQMLNHEIESESTLNLLKNYITRYYQFNSDNYEIVKRSEMN